ncbi:hypothetical protein DLM85_03260 [Hymenobacter edaphi]|uniref:Uncharacterized protein n=1 Tax=Hymenobacter edaphi TaxID=2211146 RepID=A0A328BXQ0_9BACT|nr:hypothetical protein DLM85_03260 [Hymenobacter edaphi]
MGVDQVHGQVAHVVDVAPDAAAPAQVVGPKLKQHRRQRLPGHLVGLQLREQVALHQVDAGLVAAGLARGVGFEDGPAGFQVA